MNIALLFYARNHQRVMETYCVSESRTGGSGILHTR